MTPSSAVRVRGALAGVAVFALVAGSLSLLFLESKLEAGTFGTIVFGPGRIDVRVYVLGSAAVLAGVASSLAAGDHASGTGVLAGAGGLLAVLDLVPVAPEELPVDGLPFPCLLGLEILAGLALLLAVYTAAWITDLAWVLPRREGPPHAKKPVSPRAALAVDAPCLILVGLTSVSLVAVFTERAGFGLPAGPAWFVATFVAALLVGRLFRPRSTFVVWTAPGLVLVGLLAAVGAFSPEHVVAAIVPLEGFPAGAIAPLGALGAVLGHLAARRGSSPAAGPL